MHYKVLKKQNNSDLCIVCGTKNDASLKSEFFEIENGIMVGVTTPKDIHQSYPNRMHGGMISALLDETLGRAVQIGNPDAWAVTGELTVRFKKPVPLNEEILCVGKVTKDTSRLYIAEGFIEDKNGNILATAKGTYVKAGVSAICEGGLTSENWYYVDGAPEYIQVKNLNFFNE